MNHEGHLVIVGAGPAGLATARAYREGGGRGPVTMLTTEPYPPYRRPPLTKEYLRGEASREDLPIQSDGWYEENGVELRLLTSVGAIDPEHRVVITGEGEELAYDVCVLATGSEPVRPPVPEGDDPKILTMRTVENSTCLQKRVGEGGRAVVVGSGFIGCEAAASLALRGAAVTGWPAMNSRHNGRGSVTRSDNASKVGYRTSASICASESESEASNARMAASL